MVLIRQQEIIFLQTLFFYSSLVILSSETVNLGADANGKMSSLTVEMWDCGGRSVSETLFNPQKIIIIYLVTLQ